MSHHKRKSYFYRPPVMRGFRMPSQDGDWELLFKYLPNVDDVQKILLITYICYIMTLPKLSSSKYLVLLILGESGSGKTALSTILTRIIDPTSIGAMIFPGNAKELGIFAKNLHFAVFDNARDQDINAKMSDVLCILVYGGKLGSRTLYTDDSLHLVNVHLAPAITAIDNPVSEPDLQSRCLAINLKSLKDADRLSDAKLMERFDQDLPKIMRGIFNLISDLFKYLPDITVKYPARMIDFSRYLAAFEKVRGVPEGVYQLAYLANLDEAQTETLDNDLLLSSFVEFCERMKEPFEGTAKDLLEDLTVWVDKPLRYSRSWPKNPSDLSKKLRKRKSILRANGIQVSFPPRGKRRLILITTKKLKKEAE